MATERHEIIDGHRYLVLRDDGGRIIRQLADDPPKSKQRLPEETIAAPVLAKLNSEWTPDDRDNLLRFLVANFISSRDNGGVQPQGSGR